MANKPYIELPDITVLRSEQSNLSIPSETSIDISGNSNLDLDSQDFANIGGFRTIEGFYEQENNNGAIFYANQRNSTIKLDVNSEVLLQNVYDGDQAHSTARVEGMKYFIKVDGQSAETVLIEGSFQMILTRMSLVFQKRTWLV